MNVDKPMKSMMPHGICMPSGERHCVVPYAEYEKAKLDWRSETHP